MFVVVWRDGLYEGSTRRQYISVSRIRLIKERKTPTWFSRSLHQTLSIAPPTMLLISSACQTILHHVSLSMTILTSLSASSNAAAITSPSNFGAVLPGILNTSPCILALISAILSSSSLTLLQTASISNFT